VSASLPEDLLVRASAWLAEDPDPATRAELQALIEKGDEAGLRERFEHPLTFGTAGLRGPLGAGPARMNRAVARKTTAGLAKYLKEASGEGATVVVGHDARHLSAEMALDTAKVLAANGFQALHLARALPTPITAFAVRHFCAAAGVMVTASHNPAADNGYKVYLGDGAQVLPPYDSEIAARAATAKVPGDAEISGPFGTLLAEVDEGALLAAYRKAVLQVLSDGGPRQLSTVYTPLHGVGGAVVPELLAEAGFERPVSVKAQAEPDPDFPTAPFPNPEEPGVMDLVLAEAERARADLALANDPDADRLAVAVPNRGGGGYRVLSGDELGTLIGDHLVSATAGPGRLVATTVVSSSMLSKIAHRAGVEYVETLTGFKWVARAAGLRPGHRLLFGYEEALGYAVTDAVADKDGISAALVVAEMAASAKAEGRSLLDRLDELESELGVHATAQWSLRFPGATAHEAMASFMARWRSAPPPRLGELEVTEVRDLARGYGELPPADVVVLRLGEAGRVVLRPSGTEPKVKVYFETVTAPCEMGELPEARRLARARIDAIGKDVRSLAGGR
jgi:phosphomannomutase